MKCKKCGKDLIGKEKFLCHDCWLTLKGNAKKGAITIGGVLCVAVLAVLNKEKIGDIFKGGSKDL